jgi:hypothetical protein
VTDRYVALLEEPMAEIGWKRPVRKQDLFCVAAGPLVWQFSPRGTVSRYDGSVDFEAYTEVAEQQSPPISVQSWNFIHSFVEHFGSGDRLLGRHSS